MEKEKNKLNNTNDEFENEINETVSIFDFEVTSDDEDDIKEIIGDKLNGKNK